MENAVVKQVKKVLQASASYNACDIFDAAIVGNPQFRATLKRAHEVREEMRRDHDRVTLVLLQVMALVHERWPADNIRTFLTPRLKELNCEMPKQRASGSMLSTELPVEIDSGWIDSVVAQVAECHRQLRPDEKAASARFVRRFQVENVMPR